jgi:hypothetical protein
MSTTVRGNEGSGETTVYNSPQSRPVTIQSLKFQVDTDGTAGTHAVRVRFVEPTIGAVVALDDLNVGGPSETHYYTYGLGLNASACTIADGMAVTDALPWIELVAGSHITVTPTDGTDTVISGDAISNVSLKISDDQATTLKTLPIYEMPAATAV